MGSRLNPATLIKHPGFNIPKPPLTWADSEDFNKIVEWALESAAMFISPSPKVDGEDEEFKCDDLAQAIRVDLKKLLKIRHSS